MDMGTSGCIWGHWGGYGDIGVDVGHQDGYGDIGMYIGTLGWRWGHWDGYGTCGDIGMDMGPSGWMWDIGMDMGTWGWIWGHWNVYRAIGMAMGPSGRLWEVGVAVGPSGWPRIPRDGRGDRSRTAGRTDGQMDSRTDGRGAALQADAPRDDAVPLRRPHGLIGGRRGVQQQQRSGQPGGIAALLGEQRLPLLEGGRHLQALLRHSAAAASATDTARPPRTAMGPPTDPTLRPPHGPHTETTPRTPPGGAPRDPTPAPPHTPWAHPVPSHTEVTP